MLLGAVAMTALMGAASAYAATATGRIMDINAAKDTITLKNGETFTAPKGAELNTFTVGERVKVIYATHSGANDATKIAPVAGSDASLGG